MRKFETMRGATRFPEARIDAPGVDRHAIHQSVGDAALKFFDKTPAKRLFRRIAASCELWQVLVVMG